MSLKDDVTKYYHERAYVFDETSGYTELEAERLREPIKKRFKDIFRDCNVLDIACGSGYWTTVIGETAEAVLGIDNSSSLLDQARERCKNQPNVSFLFADAYKLKGVPRGFNAVFSHGWWSHVPKKKIKSFLAVLNRKLIHGALVLFNDQLPYDGFERKQDSEGNIIERRFLPDGRSFWIVKNFPDEKEITNILSGFANEIIYTPLPEEKHWEVVYRTR